MPYRRATESPNPKRYVARLFIKESKTFFVPVIKVETNPLIASFMSKKYLLYKEMYSGDY